MERSHLLRMLSVPSASKPLSPAHARGGGAAGLPTLAEQGASLGGEAPPPEPSLVVFSGGTAFNSVAGHMRQLTTRIAHVLPVSDDGGSTAEIVRVLGGPAVGDIRSRCLRLAGVCGCVAEGRDRRGIAVGVQCTACMSASQSPGIVRAWQPTSGHCSSSTWTPCHSLSSCTSLGALHPPCRR